MRDCAGRTNNCCCRQCKRRRPPGKTPACGSCWAGKPQASWKLKLARVVLRDPANWWRTVQIDLGSRDGLRVNLPVLTTDGLVGRVSSVSLTRSQVTLLGDPNCKVAARVENETRDTGVIGPSGPLETELVELGYLVPQRQPQARASRADERGRGDLSRRAFRSARSWMCSRWIMARAPRRA